MEEDQNNCHMVPPEHKLIFLQFRLPWYVYIFSSTRFIDEIKIDFFEETRDNMSVSIIAIDIKNFEGDDTVYRNGEYTIDSFCRSSLDNGG